LVEPSFRHWLVPNTSAASVYGMEFVLLNSLPTELYETVHQQKLNHIAIAAIPSTYIKEKNNPRRYFMKVQISQFHWQYATLLPVCITKMNVYLPCIFNSYYERKTGQGKYFR
jgi:hypothetical protein